jgi:F-type H+-transporting ATPase subunit epsilon
MSIMWGFADVTPQRVTILAEVAEKAEDIDVERAQAKVLEAQARLEASGSREEIEAALTSLEKARLRKKVSDRLLQARRPH